MTKSASPVTRYSLSDHFRSHTEVGLWVDEIECVWNFGWFGLNLKARKWTGATRESVRADMKRGSVFGQIGMPRTESALNPAT
jgi:hypothetical protein